MRWFSSDFHFGHKNISKFTGRPFIIDGVADVDAMNSAIVDAVNDRVGPDDELWILGDVAMGQLDATIPIVRYLNAGSIVIVTGNHDRCHPYNGKKATGWLERYERLTGAEIINGNTETTIGGTTVNVSHFPYAGDSYDRRGDVDRFAEWRPVDDGRWLLCGHVHNAWGIRGRQINVGVDIWKRPIPESLIEDIINHKHEGWPSGEWEL